MCNKKIISLFLSLLILVPLTIQAKGAFGIVRITDMANDMTIDISENVVLENFFIFDREQEVEALTPTSTGYELRRGGLVDGEFVAFDMLVYYPELSGYIHYAGLVNYDGSICTSCSEYDDRWYVITAEAEAELQTLFANDLQPSQSFIDAFIEFSRIRFGD